MKDISRLHGRLRWRPTAVVVSALLIASILLALLFQPQGTARAAAILTITPLTWNVVGLDSNNVNTGPNNFPVGARVCNTGDAAATNVVSTFVWDSSATYIALRPGSLSAHSLPSLAAGSCTDFYYEVQVTRDSNAYNTTRRYHITAGADTLSTISTPTPREIFVEHLVSQNRNSVSDVKLDGVSVAAGGTMTLLVGNTYTIQLIGSTATNGYEQIESFINFPNTIFQVNSVATTYTANAGTDSLAATKPYADGCTWVNNPTSPNYRSCVATGKYGGNITVTYNVTIIGGAGTSQTLNTLIYDFSGSSYHYNSDFSSSSRIATIVDMDIAKAFSPASIVAGATSTLTFTIPNPTSSTVSDLNFADTLPTSPAGMTVAPTPGVTTSGCGAGTFSPALTGGETSVQFTNGTIAANGTCTISLNITVPSSPTSGTYSNTSDNLFIGTEDTENFATADLTLTTATSGGGLCGLTLASWDFPSGFSTAGPAATVANVSASALPGAGIVSLDSTQNYSGSTHSWGSNGGIATGASLNTANDDYFEFAIDTTGYSTVELTFASRRTNNGPQSLAVYYGTSGTPPGALGYDMPGFLSAAGTWFPSSGFGTLSFSSGLNPSGLTYFRIYAFAAGNSVPGSDVYLDDVSFTGCATADFPTIAKSFSPDPIAVNATSVLTFTLSNSNTAQLTGVKFTDSLPAGLQVAATPSASTTCGGSPTWSPPAAATTLTFGDPTGATIPASSSCTVSVNVTATTSGAHNNVSGFVSSTESGTNTGPSGFATDSLTALEPPVISKLFDPNPILTGGTSTLTFTILNPNSSNSLPAVAFTDTFPAGLTVASAPAASQCNGTVSSTVNSVTLAGGSIAAGASCTVSVNVTASGAGDYANVSGVVSATISGVTTNGNTAADTLTVEAPNPSISLLKQVSTSASGPWSSFVTVTPGADVYYQFTIENTGDVPLSPVSVTDATVSTAGCAWPASLPVASPIQDPTAVCVVGPVTALAGHNPNTATAHGTYTAVVYDSNPSTAAYLGANAGFSLLKQVSDSAAGPWSSAISGVPPGSNIYYKFTIINTGSLELSAINVTDPDVSTGTCTFTDPLAVNDATTCVVGPVTASASPGTFTNTAVAHGTNSATIYDTAPSSADYTVTLTPPDLTVSKTNDAGGAVTLPTPFTWTLQVSNAGGAGDAVFANGQTIVSDPLPANATYGSPSAGSFVNITNSANISCSITSGTPRCTASGAAVTISAGGSFAVSLTVTPTATGSLTNTATVDPLGNVAESNEGNNTDTDVVTVSASGPEMTLLKSADLTAVDTAGETITYTITIENTGNVQLTNVDVSDSLLTNLDCSGGGTQDFTINVGATLTCTGTYSVLQSDLDNNGGGDGDIDNTVTVTSGELGPQTASETVSIVQDPVIDIIKTSTTAEVTAAGQGVPYDFAVSNAGNITLTNISVTDANCDSAPAYQSGDAGTLNALDVGETWNYTCTHTVTQAEMDAGGDLSNTATADSDESLPDESSLDIPITQTPGLSLAKTEASSGPYAVNDTITYSIVATNSGNVTLTAVTITDPGTDVTLGICSPSNPADLAPGEAITCAASHVVTQDNINAGTFTNTAIATSDQVVGPITDDATVTFTQSALLTITKEVSEDNANWFDSVTVNPGDTVYYRVTVDNAGNVDLTAISVLDTDCSLIGPTGDDGDSVLQTTETWVYTCSVTAAAGQHTNTATADSAETDPEVQDSAEYIAEAPLIGVAKDVSSITDVSPGVYDVTFSILVQNYGNVSLSAVQVTDDLTLTFPSPTTFSVQSLTSSDFSVNNIAYNGDTDINLLDGTDSLAVSGSGTITLVVRVTPANNGPFNNTATASGTSPSNTTVNDDSQNGLDPDENGDDDPTDDNDPTPVDFGANLFDPPFGIKVFDDSGLPALRWTMIWINDANVAAVNALVSDPIPTGTAYSAAGASSGFAVPGGAPAGSTNVGVTCEPDPLSIATTTTLCYYEGPTGLYPLGRIIWQGTLGPDLGATDAATAANEIVIRFNVVVGAGTTSAFNTATIDSDLNGDTDATDPGEQQVATASALWNLSVDPGVSSLPNTGFAPGRITALPFQPDEFSYAASDLILEVPRLGINVRIVGVPYTASGWNVTWLGNQAGYLDGTAFPTWVGNSVITGHVYLSNGLPGPFVSLGQLRYGDQVIVHFAGQRYVYEVRENKVISPKDKSVFQHEQLSWITLVTCKDFNESTDAYAHRVAVRAVLVRVEPDSSGR